MIFFYFKCVAVQGVFTEVKENSTIQMYVELGQT